MWNDNENESCNSQFVQNNIALKTKNTDTNNADRKVGQNRTTLVIWNPWLIKESLASNDYICKLYLGQYFCDLHYSWKHHVAITMIIA